MSQRIRPRPSAAQYLSRGALVGLDRDGLVCNRPGQNYHQGSCRPCLGRRPPTAYQPPGRFDQTPVPHRSLSWRSSEPEWLETWATRARPTVYPVVPGKDGQTFNGAVCRSLLSSLRSGQERGRWPALRAGRVGGPLARETNITFSLEIYCVPCKFLPRAPPVLDPAGVLEIVQFDHR